MALMRIGPSGSRRPVRYRCRRHKATSSARLPDSDIPGCGLCSPPCSIHMRRPCRPGRRPTPARKRPAGRRKIGRTLVLGFRSMPHGGHCVIERGGAAHHADGGQQLPARRAGRVPSLQLLCKCRSGNASTHVAAQQSHARRDAAHSPLFSRDQLCISKNDFRDRPFSRRTDRRRAQNLSTHARLPDHAGAHSLLIWVRCSIRRAFSSKASRLCMVQRLSHSTRSPGRQTCVQLNSSRST